MLTSVYYTNGRVVIDTIARSFAAGTLRASFSGEQINITEKTGTFAFASPQWDDVSDSGGNVFGTPADALAYVQGELAKVPPQSVSYRMAPPSLGQTTFELPTPPSDVNTVVMTINGADYYPPDVAASSVQVVWQGDFQLEPGDSVRVSYT